MVVTSFGEKLQISSPVAPHLACGLIFLLNLLTKTTIKLLFVGIFLLLFFYTKADVQRRTFEWYKQKLFKCKKSKNITKAESAKNITNVSSCHAIDKQNIW